MAEVNNLTEVSQDRCRCLRSKEMFIDVDSRAPSFGSGIFWCIHTQNCLGPDGQVADLESCKPGRACYESI